jgi:hypothetical protein
MTLDMVCAFGQEELKKLRKIKVQEKHYDRKVLGESNPKKYTKFSQTFDVFQIYTIHIKHLSHVIFVF